MVNVSSSESFVEETVVLEDNDFRKELQMYKEVFEGEGAGSVGGGRQLEASSVEDGSGTRFKQGPTKVPFLESAVSGKNGEKIVDNPITNLVWGVQGNQQMKGLVLFFFSGANVAQEVLTKPSCGARGC